MKASVLSNITQTWLPMTSFLIFFIFFLGLLVWVFKAQTKSDCMEAQEIPLSEGEKV